MCAFPQVLTSIAMMAVGALCMSYNDLAFDATGYLWCDAFPRPSPAVPEATSPHFMNVLRFYFCIARCHCRMAGNCVSTAFYVAYVKRAMS